MTHLEREVRRKITSHEVLDSNDRLLLGRIATEPKFVGDVFLNKSVQDKACFDFRSGNLFKL